MRLLNNTHKNIRISNCSRRPHGGTGFQGLKLLAKSKPLECSPALKSLIGCFKTKNPVDIEEALDVFK